MNSDGLALGGHDGHSGGDCLRPRGPVRAGLDRLPGILGYFTLFESVLYVRPINSHVYKRCTADLGLSLGPRCD